MSRKFVGKLIRIMMTKSSSCDILKKKRTIRRGSSSRPKGSYLMDLRFWNYVIPDGSTTRTIAVSCSTFSYFLAIRIASCRSFYSTAGGLLLLSTLCWTVHCFSLVPIFPLCTPLCTFPVFLFIVPLLFLEMMILRALRGLISILSR